MNGVLWLIKPEMKWTSRDKSIELGDDDRRSLATALGGVQRRSELRATVERVGAFAGLDLGEGLQEVESLGFGETGERGLLRFEAETGAALTLGRNAGVSDGGTHDFEAFP